MKTSDIGVATALATMGAYLDGVDHDGKRATFQFDNDEFCKVVEHLFCEGKLFVDAKKWHEQYRRLMSYTRTTY